MSINACSIDGNTIDSICGSRRAVIIANLLPQAQKSHPQKVSPDTTLNLNMFRRDYKREEEEVDFATIEHPLITITVSHQGKDYVHTLERGNGWVPMVNVYGISYNKAVTEHINISDFTLKVIV